MSISIQPISPGPTIFDAPGDDPRLAIADALAAIDDTAARYRRSNDILDAIALLDAIEGLRRFIMVRRTLASCLSESSRPGAQPWGRDLCQLLQAMIGDVPSLAETCKRNGHYRMERDMRRAIACLIFLGSLNPDFI
jgi:hypothetical protein